MITLTIPVWMFWCVVAMFAIQAGVTARHTYWTKKLAELKGEEG